MAKGQDFSDRKHWVRILPPGTSDKELQEVGMMSSQKNVSGDAEEAAGGTSKLDRFKNWIKPIYPLRKPTEARPATPGKGLSPPRAQKPMFAPKRKPPGPISLPMPAADIYTGQPTEADAIYDIHQDATDTFGAANEYDDPPCHDSFFDSSKVIGLNQYNFSTFLTNKAVTMVMFYKDCLPASDAFQKIVSEAADSTVRENHAFVGVDCDTSNYLCKFNGVNKLPLLRLYSKDYCLGEISCIHSISPEVLRQLVEMAPVTDDSRMVSCSLPTFP